MASDTDKLVSEVSNSVDNLSIGSLESCNKSNLENGLGIEDDETISRWGFPLTELYRLALKFYKGESLRVRILLT